MPGKVNTVINIPTWVSDKSRASIMAGNAGDMLETPKTAIKVTPNIMARFLPPPLNVFSSNYKKLLNTDYFDNDKFQI